MMTKNKFVNFPARLTSPGSSSIRIALYKLCSSYFTRQQSYRPLRGCNSPSCPEYQSAVVAVPHLSAVPRVQRAWPQGVCGQFPPGPSILSGSP